MTDKKHDHLYQIALNHCYGEMNRLVKAGRLDPGWQRDREAVRKLKKAAKIYAKNALDKLNGEIPHGKRKYLARIEKAKQKREHAEKKAIQAEEKPGQSGPGPEIGAGQQRSEKEIQTDKSSETASKKSQ